MTRKELAAARKNALAIVAQMVDCTVHHRGEDGLILGEAISSYGWYGGCDPMVAVQFGERRAILKLSEMGVC